MECLKAMVRDYRVSELQDLLRFSGKDGRGNKRVLQARALELLKNIDPPLEAKIRELYHRRRTSRNAISGGSTTTLDTAVSTNGRINIAGTSRPLQNGGEAGTSLKIKELPFYEIIDNLLPPRPLGGDNPSRSQDEHRFKLSASSLDKISDTLILLDKSTRDPRDLRMRYSAQIQLRIVALDSTSGEYVDEYPPKMNLHVNRQLVTLPTPIPSNRVGAPPKQPYLPLDITDKIIYAPGSVNIVQTCWFGDLKQRHYLVINLVKVLTAEDLMGRLIDHVESADVTRAQIKRIFLAEKDGDFCAPTSIHVTLLCPLGMTRMEFPCKAMTCKHIQCFDANLFLKMNEKKSTFKCPVCNEQLKFGDLRINGYFKQVIESGVAGDEIEIFPDGSWAAAAEKKRNKDYDQHQAKKLKRTSAISKIKMEEDSDDDLKILEIKEGPSTSVPKPVEESFISNQHVTSSSRQLGLPGFDPVVVLRQCSRVGAVTIDLTDSD